MTLSDSTAREVVTTLAKHFKVDVLGRAVDSGPSAQRFGSQVSARRAEAMYVLRRLGMTFEAIGRLFRRDHTTVIHACRRVEERIQTVVGYGQEVLVLEDMANGVVKMAEERAGQRCKLADERPGLVLHFVITTRPRDGGEGTIDVDGYLRTGLYEDGRLGEIFLTMGKIGHQEAAVDSWATAVSIGLQYGVPLEVFCAKEIGKHFWPGGATNVKEVPRCTSPFDLVCRWLLLRYGKVQQ